MNDHDAIVYTITDTGMLRSVSQRAGQHYAQCSCGWSSDYLPTADAAQRALDDHIVYVTAVAGVPERHEEVR